MPERKDNIQQVVQEKYDEEHLAQMFKALSHPVRIRLLRRLARSERYCGDLVAEFNMAQSTISHHLRVLRECELITAEEQGTRTCYSLQRAQLQRMYEKLVGIESW